MTVSQFVGLNVSQWVGRMNHWQRTGCEACAAALVASGVDRAAIERGPPSPEPEDD